MIVLSRDTAFFFDTADGSVRPVPYTGKFNDLKELLKVKMVDIIRLDSEHIIFVDDEGFLNMEPKGFRITDKTGRQIEFAGNGLLTGDNYGNNAPVTLNLADLKIEVIEIEYEEA